MCFPSGSRKDLQERKRLLVENADALVVLPGGPGTWDEVNYLNFLLYLVLPFGSVLTAI